MKGIYDYFIIIKNSYYYQISRSKNRWTGRQRERQNERGNEREQ